MSTALKIIYHQTVGQWRIAMEQGNKKVAHAATAMMRAVADDVKSRGRASIAAGGFSRKWQNAFRVNLYPKSKDSIDPAVWAYHKIIYAGIFEKGGTISGRPILWIPVKGLKSVGRGHITPEKWASRYGPLVKITSHAGNLILLGRRSRQKKTKLEPIFVGLPLVHIRKRFHLENVFRTAAAKMPSLYFQNLKV